MSLNRRNTRYYVAPNIAILNYWGNESFLKNCKDYIILFYISILQKDFSKDLGALTKLHFPQRQLWKTKAYHDDDRISNLQQRGTGAAITILLLKDTMSFRN